MPQIRITQKFAVDCRCGKLQNPRKRNSFFDDWVIDVFRISRKKVAIISHAQTLLTFLIPYSQVGGAKGIYECIPVLLQQFLYDHGFEEYLSEMEQVFASPLEYCKTQDRRMIGHMNDFKRCIIGQVQWKEISFEEIDWDELMDDTNQMPINLHSVGFTSPIELINDALRR